MMKADTAAPNLGIENGNTSPLSAITIQRERRRQLPQAATVSESRPLGRLVAVEKSMEGVARRGSLRKRLVDQVLAAGGPMVLDQLRFEVQEEHAFRGDPSRTSIEVTWSARTIRDHCPHLVVHKEASKPSMLIGWSSPSTSPPSISNPSYTLVQIGFATG